MCSKGQHNGRGVDGTIPKERDTHHFFSVSGSVIRWAAPTPQKIIQTGGDATMTQLSFSPKKEKGASSYFQPKKFCPVLCCSCFFGISREKWRCNKIPPNSPETLEFTIPWLFVFPPTRYGLRLGNNTFWGSQRGEEDETKCQSVLTALRERDWPHFQLKQCMEI